MTLSRPILAAMVFDTQSRGNSRVADLIEHFSIATQGLTVSHVWRGHGSALFVELGQLVHPVPTKPDRRPKPRGEVGVMMEWSWRIESGNSILCGSWSDERHWQPAFDLLTGQKVLTLSVFGRLPEISLSLSNNLYVASFMTAEGDPSWALFDRRNREETLSIICRSGAVVQDK